MHKSYVHTMQAIPRLMDPVDGEKAAYEMVRLTNNTSASEDTAAARAGALQVCVCVCICGSVCTRMGTDAAFMNKSDGSGQVCT
jgi:hypothetical protein